MPRRWPPNKTLLERMTWKGAAVADHLKALTAGVQEVLKPAFAEEEANRKKEHDRA